MPGHLKGGRKLCTKALLFSERDLGPRGCASRVGQTTTMRRRSYQAEDLGSTTLLRAGSHSRDLARLEFSYGNFEEGLFLAQLARDLETIADGQPLRSTSIWRALEVQFPSLFSGEINQRLAVALQAGEDDSREAA